MIGTGKKDVMGLEKTILTIIMLLVAFSSLLFINIGVFNTNLASFVITYEKENVAENIAELKLKFGNAIPPQEIRVKDNEILLYSCIDDTNENHECDQPESNTLTDGLGHEIFKELSYKTLFIENYPEFNERLYITVSGYSGQGFGAGGYISMLGLVAVFDAKPMKGDSIIIDKQYTISSIAYDPVTDRIKYMTISNDNNAYVLESGSNFKDTTVFLGSDRIIFYKQINQTQENSNLLDFLGYNISLSQNNPKTAQINIKKDTDKNILICGNGLGFDLHSGRNYNKGLMSHSCIKYVLGEGFINGETYQDHAYVSTGKNHILMLDMGNGIVLWEPLDAVYINSNLHVVGYKLCENAFCNDYDVRSLMFEPQDISQNYTILTHYGTSIRVYESGNGIKSIKTIDLNIPAEPKTETIKVT